MDPTDEVTLTVRRKGLIYVQRLEISYTGIPPNPANAMRELEYQVAGAWVKIARDIKRFEEVAVTNPFAWSSGPVE